MDDDDDGGVTMDDDDDDDDGGGDAVIKDRLFSAFGNMVVRLKKNYYGDEKQNFFFKNSRTKSFLFK